MIKCFTTLICYICCKIYLKILWLPIAGKLFSQQKIESIRFRTYAKFCTFYSILYPKAHHLFVANEMKL